MAPVTKAIQNITNLNQVREALSCPRTHNTTHWSRPMLKLKPPDPQSNVLAIRPPNIRVIIMEH